MKGGGRRPDQIAEVIRQVVAATLLSEMRDPRIGFVTVTGVEVTRDLAHATLRVSIMGEAAEREASLAGLRGAAGFLRGKVGQALTSRIVPELHFELDRGQEHAARINQILDGLREEQHD